MASQLQNIYSFTRTQELFRSSLQSLKQLTPPKQVRGLSMNDIKPFDTQKTNRPLTKVKQQGRPQSLHNFGPQKPLDDQKQHSGKYIDNRTAYYIRRPKEQHVTSIQDLSRATPNFLSQERFKPQLQWDEAEAAEERPYQHIPRPQPYRIDHYPLIKCSDTQKDNVQDASKTKLSSIIHKEEEPTSINNKSTLLTELQELFAQYTKATHQQTQQAQKIPHHQVNYIKLQCLEQSLLNKSIAKSISLNSPIDISFQSSVKTKISTDNRKNLYLRTKESKKTVKKPQAQSKGKKPFKF